MRRTHLLALVPLLLSGNVSAIVKRSNCSHQASQDAVQLVTYYVTVPATGSATEVAPVKNDIIGSFATPSDSSQIRASSTTSSSTIISDQTLVSITIAPQAIKNVISTTTSSTSFPSNTDVPSAPLETGNSTSDFAGYKNAVYFTNWGIYGSDYQPQDLPVSDLTHVLYAFADIGADGTVKTSDSYADIDKHYDGADSWSDTGNNTYGCIKQLYLLKKNNRHLKILLSIGGWTYSPNLAPVAATEDGRQTFASSAVRMMVDYGFDGLDLDWESPANAEEAANFVLLLKACRETLDEYSSQNQLNFNFLITVASPAGSTHYVNMDLRGMDQYIDAWHLMSYDYAGAWDSTTGHQSNLFNNAAQPVATKFNTEEAVQYYQTQGISSKKIILGLPLYGRSFEDTNGIGESYNGIGEGNPQPGVWSYKFLPRLGATVSWDDVAKASWSYDGASRELITYDNVESATVKTDYVFSRGLGGMFFWEASGDKTDKESLIGTTSSTLGSLDLSPNNLNYPTSQYDNIRNGMPGN